VTPDQITALGLETRPTKASGHANAAGFTRRRGKAAGTLHDSVEVDAIDSNLLRDMVRDAIERHIDQHALEITRVAERSEREVLERMAKRRRAG